MKFANSRTWPTNSTSYWPRPKPTCRTIRSPRGGSCFESLFPEPPEPGVISKSCMPVSKRSTSSPAGAISLTSKLQDGTLIQYVTCRSRSSEIFALRNCQGARKREPASARLPLPVRQLVAVPRRERRSDKKGSQVTTSARHRETAGTSEAADSQDSRSGRRAEQGLLSESRHSTRRPLPAS